MSNPLRISCAQYLEREHREVRGKTKVHLPNRLIPGLGGERMMLQDLGVPEIAFQRATSSEPARSRHAVCQLHCLRCATHCVGHGKQQVCSLVQRECLSRYRCFPRDTKGVVEQQATRA
jgi:hypothetical protein